MTMRTITVGINETGQRLTRILSKYLRTAPDSFLYRMLRKKNIVLNGHKASGKEILQAGDTILIYMSEDTICKFGGPSLEINTAEDTDLPDAASLDDILIYEDDRLLIVNKPAGMLSQKSKGSDQSLIDLIIAYLRSMGELSDSQMATFRPGLASRLDRNTSGIVIAGKTLASLQELNALTKEHVLSKHYIALIEGEMNESRLLDGYWVKDKQNNKVVITQKPSEGASRVRTAVCPLSCGTDSLSGKTATCVRIELLTGKGHQIRAHLASIGHPLIGDVKYGAGRCAFRKGHMLHAYEITFPDECVSRGISLAYLSGRTFRAPVPDDFLKAMDAFCIKKEF